MDKSKAAILAIFLVVIASCVPLPSAARSPGLTTTPAPADGTAVLCRTNADCEELICSPIGCSASCWRGECTCKVCAPDVPPQAESTGLAPANAEEAGAPVAENSPAVHCPPSECSKFLSCLEGCPKLDHDRCQCVVSVETSAF